MSFWGTSSSASKQNAPKIRIEKVAVKAPPPPIAKVARLKTQAAPARSHPSSRPTQESKARISKSVDSSRLKPRSATNVRKPRSPARQVFDEDDSEDDDSPASYVDFTMKPHTLGTMGIADPNRRIRSLREFSDVDLKTVIAAADLTSSKPGFLPVFPPDKSVEGGNIAYLQYPGARFPERYELVYRKGEFNPVAEIEKVVELFTEFFLTSKQAREFLNPDTGIKRRLERARGLDSLSGYKTALHDFNEAVVKLRKNGSLATNLDRKTSLPLSLVSLLLTQAYDRAVSPCVEMLKKDINSKSEVYGELNANLIYSMLVDVELQSHHVLVDLGSGVANVVLQAALQIGCESWGCEIMKNSCDLADAYKVNIERGDFMANANILSTLRRADLVVVNNEVFTPQLNNDLIHLFLELKDGCKIISLQSFVPTNHNPRWKPNDVINMLEVQTKIMPTASVSWKNEGGNYYVATKDSTRLQRFAEQEE